MDDTSESMQAYYARDRERDRLATAVGRVEFARTIEAMEHALPPAPATVADIGCGPGRYSAWLVEAGYHVIARDPVADHIDQIQALLPGDQRFSDQLDAAVGDARSIDLADGCVDAVLLLGPLYHLPILEDRLQALGEAARIVRPGGVVLAAGILRWAARLDPILVREAHVEDPGLLGTATEMEATGIMRPFTPAGFTGYAHTPAEFREEIEHAGLHIESLISVEGIAFALDDLDGRMDDPERRAVLLDSLRLFDGVPDMVGVGMHLLAVARRQHAPTPR